MMNNLKLLSIVVCFLGISLFSCSSDDSKVEAELIVAKESLSFGNGAEMQKLADKYGMDLESVKKYLPAAQVREQVIREKVVKLVADSAVAVAPEAEEKKEDKAEETAE